MKEAIAAHRPTKDGKHRFADDAALMLARNLERAEDDLQGREDEVKWLPKPAIDALQKGCALLQRLLSQVQEIEPGPEYRLYRGLRGIVFRGKGVKVGNDD